MAFQFTNSLRKVQSVLKATGLFRDVLVGEPKAPPVSGSSDVVAAIFLSAHNVLAVFANGGLREQHIVIVRVYRDALAEPTEQVEVQVADVVSKTEEQLLKDANLNDEVMEVRAIEITTTWGYVDVGGRMYRIADMSLPLIVDDSATATP